MKGHVGQDHIWEVLQAGGEVIVSLRRVNLGW